MEKYRWSTPFDWLIDKANESANRNDVGDLVSMIDHLAGRLDQDAIQDLFQTEMKADGYFEPLNDEVA